MSDNFTWKDHKFVVPIHAFGAILPAEYLENDSALFVAITSVFGITFGTYAGTSAVIFKTPYLKHGISFSNNFARQIPLLINVEKSQTVGQYLNTVRQQLKDTYTYQNFPISQALGGENLFESNVSINFIGFHAEQNAQDNIDLSFTVMRSKESITFSVAFNEAVFEVRFIDRIRQHFLHVLYQLEDRNKLLIELSVLPPAEVQRLLDVYGYTGTVEPRFTAVHHFFEAAAERTPKAIALKIDDQEFSYEELNIRANRLAHYLVQHRATDNGANVGLYMERNEWMVISMLAVLKANAVYVPLDPAYPADRLLYMASDSGITCVLTNLEIDRREKLGKCAVQPVQIHDLDLTGFSINNIPFKKRSTENAYIIYTSGSTGQPKGVQISHNNAVYFIEWAVHEFGNDKFDVVFSATSYCFDLSIFEIFVAFALGKTVRLLGSFQEIAPNLKTDQNVLLNTVPSVINYLLESAADLSNVRSINMAGEQIPYSVLQALDCDQITVRNLYGPSEDTTYSTYYRFSSSDKRVLIGKPISNTRLYILDQDMNILPEGVPGEIYLSGQGISQGYYNKPELTASLFIRNPFHHHSVLYRTGDIGKWMEGGNVKFLGRKDHQVKLRGYRIELSEIEVAITNTGMTKEVVVHVHTDSGGEKSLLAYCVFTGQSDGVALKEQLSLKLPEYMIPPVIIGMTALPRTPNGKIDRKSLPDPGLLAESGPIVLPSNHDEENLTVLWKKTLRKDDIGVTQNFFEVGGNSLKASTLLAAISRDLHVNLELSDIFGNPTIREQAKLLLTKQKSVYCPIEKAVVAEDFPLSNAQQRLWTLEQMDTGVGAYNMPGIYSIDGSLDRIAFQKALSCIIERHEILRTCFFEINGTPRARILEASQTGFSVRYLEAFDSDIDNFIATEISRPFDLSQAPLMRACLVRCGDNKHIFIITLHHIISDETSDHVLLKEFSSLYTDFVTTGESSLPPLTVQYKDYEAWLRKWLTSDAANESRVFWRNQFANGIHAPVLIADKLRPKIKTFNGAREKLRLDVEHLVQLRRFSSDNNTSLFMTLLAIQNIILRQWCHQEDILILVPASGRTHPDLHNQIGFYANTLPIQTKVSSQVSFNDLVAIVKAAVLNAYKHQNYPYDSLVEDLGIRYDASRSGLSEVMMVLQEGDAEKPAFAGLEFRPYENKVVGTRFDMVFFYNADNHGLELEIGYNEDLFFSDTIRQLLRDSEQIISQLLRFPALPINDAGLNLKTNATVANGEAVTDLLGNRISLSVVKNTLESSELVQRAYVYKVHNHGREKIDIAIEPSANAFTLRALAQTKANEPALPFMTFPNGLSLHYINRAEAEFTYREIVDSRSYQRNGITIAEGDVIFDVGANLGLFSIDCALHHPGITVYAFEPLGPIFRLLEKNISLYPQLHIHCFNYGAGSNDECVEFTYYPNNTIISSRYAHEKEDKEIIRQFLSNTNGALLDKEALTELADAGTVAEKFSCRLIRLSDFVRQQGIETIHLLKVDVEKSEWDVLEGIDNATWSKVQQVVIEVHDLQGRLRKIMALLESKGFRVAVEEEGELQKTNLYNVYAVKHLFDRDCKQGKLATSNGVLTDPSAFLREIEKILASRVLDTDLISQYLLAHLDGFNGEPADHAELLKIAALVLPPSGPPREKPSLRSLNVNIGATFVAEPLTDTFTWWGKQFGFYFRTKYAAYNQLYQELIMPTGLFRINEGANFVLIRVEDLIRHLSASDNENRLKIIREQLGQLVDALRDFNYTESTFVGIFPLVEQEVMPINLVHDVNSILAEINSRLRMETAVSLVDLHAVTDCFAIDRIIDKDTDQQGHIPFDAQYYTAIATFMARKVIFSHRETPIKVIVLDCDNTLWSGICGEDSLDQISLDEGHLFLQSFLLAKKQEGFLLALCSKNNEQDVWNVFMSKEGMILKQEHFVSWKINWEPKSANLRLLAEELNLGIDSLCLLDDSLVECSEVMTQCPEIFTLCVPPKSEDFRQFLMNIWGLDKRKITDEDKRRSEMYKAEIVRKKILKHSISVDEFLKKLEVKVYVDELRENDVTRGFQLFQRTNQFNLSGEKLDEHQFRSMLNSKNMSVLRVDVSDRYGDYGFTGLAVVQMASSIVKVCHLMLSCRVLGRKVEYAVMAAIQQMATERHAVTLEIVYRNNGRNSQVKNFLDGFNFQHEILEQGVTIYRSPIGAATFKHDSIELLSTAPSRRENIQTLTDQTSSSKFYFDHVGVAVSDIYQEQERYRKLGFACSAIVYDPVQKVDLVMCVDPASIKVELIGAHGSDSPVAHMLKKGIEGPYHICFNVESIKQAIDEMRDHGLEFTVISEPAPAVLFGGRQVAFVHFNHGGLIELLQTQETIDVDVTPSGTAEINYVCNDVEQSHRLFEIFGYRADSYPGSSDGGVVVMRNAHGPVINLFFPTDGSAEARLLKNNGTHPVGLFLDKLNGAQDDLRVPYAFKMARRTARHNLITRNPVVDIGAQRKYYPYYLPFIYPSVESIMHAVVHQNDLNTTVPDDYQFWDFFSIQVGEIWKKVTGRLPSSTRDSFFSLGGNSIKATQLLSKVNSAFSIRIRLTDFLNNPTIGFLSSKIRSRIDKVIPDIGPAEINHEGYPLTEAQKEIWLLEQQTRTKGLYKITGFYHLSGELDIDALEQAFCETIDKYEILRTSFATKGSRPVQVIAEADKLRFKIHRLEPRPSPLTETLIEQFNIEEQSIELDLEKGPLLRVTLRQLIAGEYLLSITVHHIIYDGWSAAVLLDCVLDSYNRVRKHLPTKSNALLLQFKDYAMWQNALNHGEYGVQARKFWQSRLDETVRPLRLPYDFTAPVERTFIGNTETFVIETTQLTSLLRWCSKEGATIFNFFVSAIYIVLNKISGDSDVVFGMPVNTRESENLNDQIGIFVNLLPVRLHPKDDSSFRELLKLVRQETANTLTYSSYPIGMILNDLAIGYGSTSRLFNVVIQLQDSAAGFTGEYHDGKLSVRFVPTTHRTSKFDLLFNIMPLKNKVDIDIEYSEELFRNDSIKGIRNHLIEIIRIALRDGEVSIAEIKNEINTVVSGGRKLALSQMMTTINEDF